MKVERYAKRWKAWLVIVENTARGPDLIEHLKTKLAMPIEPVNPRGTKASRLRKCASVIRARKIRINDLPAVEEAIDEIVAYPNSPNDDHVDAMTNFLLNESEFFKLTPMNSTDHNPNAAAGASASIEGVVILRRRSIFDGTPNLPDFSNGEAEPQRRADGRSFYDANSSPEPSFSFDGKKLVRL